MKANPYSTALFSVGAILIVLAGISFVIGVAQQNGYAADGGLVWFAAAGGMFPLGVVGMIAWLLLEGLSWRHSNT